MIVVPPHGWRRGHNFRDERCLHPRRRHTGSADGAPNPKHERSVRAVQRDGRRDPARGLVSRHHSEDNRDPRGRSAAVEATGQINDYGRGRRGKLDGEPSGHAGHRRGIAARTMRKANYTGRGGTCNVRTQRGRATFQSRSGRQEGPIGKFSHGGPTYLLSERQFLIFRRLSHAGVHLSFCVLRKAYSLTPAPSVPCAQASPHGRSDRLSHRLQGLAPGARLR